MAEISSALLPALLPKGGTGSDPCVNPVKPRSWSALLMVKWHWGWLRLKRKDKPSAAAVDGSCVAY